MTSLLRHVVPGGAAWSAQVKRGREMTFTAVAERANVSLLLFAAGDPVDRMNIPDTLKSQYSMCIRPPMVLMSDRGVGLASVTGSSLSWHDALGGHGLRDEGSYALDGNDWHRGARTGLLSELRKHGRGEADLHAAVNIFSKVAVDDAARLFFVADHAGAGDWMTLRSEVDLLVILSTAPHPMDPQWSPSGVAVDVQLAGPIGADDPSLLFREESARALHNAASVFA